MIDRSGEIIHGFELLERIGEGSFASVYRATQQSVKRSVAVKIIHPQHLTNPEFIQRFHEEAEIIARLENPHIVPLYDFWADERGAYIAMQWMGGGSLQNRLRQVTKFEPAEVSHILGQIAPALALVHRKNIIHRDLKPANMLLDDNDNIYIADFGLAKQLGVKSDLSANHQIIGTPHYMSPEQAATDNGVTLGNQSDIYSLGIILYEILTGSHPFGNAPLMQMLLHHRHDPLPPLRKIVPTLPEELEPVIQRATAKQPDQRFSDAVELAAAFQSALDIARRRRSRTTTITPIPLETKTAGDLHARMYTQAGTIIEQPRRLVGRDDLVKRVQIWLDQGERVLLHGLGGIGKTAMAASVAADYIACGKGAVMWVQLGRQDADTLFEAVAHVLGQHQKIAGKQGEDRIAAMRELLLEQKALLVIDNIWKERAILPIIRAIPLTMPLLMTSRYGLSIDGIMIAMDALEADDALSLLSYYARHDYTTDGAAKRLCHMLGNHPYAVELAGKRLQAYRHLNPDRLMHNIKDAPHNLPTGPLDEQRTIKDLLNESVSELDEEAKRVFQFMGAMYTSRTSLELLALVVGREVAEIESQVAELEHSGLARLFMEEGQPDHYRFHDLTYSYASAMFADGGEGRKKIIQAVRRFIKSNLSDYSKLDFELVNIVEAAQAASKTHDTESLIDIMKMLSVDAKYLAARGPTAISLELLEAAIEAAKLSGDIEAAHYMAGKLGDIYRLYTLQFQKALIAYQVSLDFARELKNQAREAIILTLIGTTHFQLGADDPNIYYDAAYKMAQSLDDPNALMTVLNHRSFYEGQKLPPNFQASHRYSDETATLCRQHNMVEGLIASLMNRASCERELGQLERALDSDKEAHDTALGWENYLLIAKTSHSLGNDYHGLHDYFQAISYLKKAVEFYGKAGIQTKIDEIYAFAQKNNYEMQSIPSERE